MAKELSGKETLLFTGYAKLPAAITAEKLFEEVGIAVEVDPQTSEIIDADCTLATRVAREFFRKQLVGYQMNAGIDPLIKKLDRQYHGSARKALVTALKSMFDRYLAIK